MQQQALTAIVPIKPGEVEALRQILSAIGQNIKKNPTVDFYQSPSTHFARLVILEQPRDARLGPRLFFSSNYDGDFESYMEELVSNFGSRMEEIWNKCEGYPAGAAQNPQRFARFITEYSYPHIAFYNACPGASVQSIRNSARVRQMVDRVLDRDEANPWLKQLLPLLPHTQRNLSQPASKVAAVYRLMADSGAVRALVVGFEYLVGVRRGRNENRTMTVHDELAVMEDLVVQNQMTVIVPIKSRFLLRLVFAAIRLKVRTSYGSLAGLATIHFARWVIIDNSKNLLFESNYDGSWENYIDDFVDFASTGMNVIWANCAGFPTGGCRDIEWFKQYIRENQIPAQVFYSAYPDTTVKNKLTDLQLAGSIGQFLGQQDVERFLAGAYQPEAFRSLPAPFREAPVARKNTRWLLALGAMLSIGLYSMVAASGRASKMDGD